MTVTVPIKTEIIMPTPENPHPYGMRVYGRRGSSAAKLFGVVIGYGCALDGGPLNLCVHLKDGSQTWVSTERLQKHRYGMQIV